MKLTVITSVYNADAFLYDSLQSLVDQTYKDFEAILIDDGSTDNSFEIMKSYADRHSNFRLLRNMYNEGVPISRNRGLIQAKGDYIAIHDGDDISLHNRFEKQEQ